MKKLNNNLVLRLSLQTKFTQKINQTNEFGKLTQLEASIHFFLFFCFCTDALIAKAIMVREKGFVEMMD